VIVSVTAADAVDVDAAEQLVISTAAGDEVIADAAVDEIGGAFAE
jgi:hypothetical protein